MSGIQQDGKQVQGAQGELGQWDRQPGGIADPQLLINYVNQANQYQGVEEIDLVRKNKAERTPRALARPDKVLCQTQGVF